MARKRSNRITHLAREDGSTWYNKD
jgi:hypothetical protein